MKNNLNYLLILFLLLISACKSTVNPILFDKTYENLKNEIDIITMQINNNNFEISESRLKKDLIIYKNNPQLLTLKVYLLIKQEKNEEALKAGENLLISNKSNPLLYALLSKIYYNLGNKEKASNFIKLSLNISKNIPYAWYQKGLYEFNDKNYNSSEISFNRAYYLDKTNLDAYFFRYLSKIYIKKNIDEIKNEWNNFRSLITLQPIHYIYHAIALYEIGNIENSEIILKEGYLLFPEDPYILNFYAYLQVIKFKDKDEKDNSILESALSNIVLALTKIVNPEFADTHLNILYLMKDFDKLKNNYNKYKLLFPENQLILDWTDKIDLE